MKDELQPSSGSLACGPPARPVTLGTVLGLLLLAAVVLTPYCLCRQPAWVDEAIFAYMASGPSAQGLPYYRAGYDNKPPGIFALYQLVGVRDRAGLGRVRGAEGLLVLGTCLVLLFWLRREVSPVAGWWAAYLYALFLAFTPGCLALTEPPLAALSAAGMCLGYYGVQRRRPGLLAGAGVALGVAACFKQVAMFDLLALLVVVGVGRGRGRAGNTGETPVPPGRGWGQVAWVAGGFLACAVAVGVGMAATGQARAGWETVVLALGGAGQAARGRNLLEYWRWIMPVLQVPAFVALLAYLTPLRRPLGLLLGAWLVAGCVGVSASGLFLNHQSVQFFAPLAALSGAGGAWLWQAQAGRTRWSTLAMALLTLLVFSAPGDKYRIRLQQEISSRHQVGASPEERIGAWLRQQVAPGETIYVLGNGLGVYFYAQRRAPTRYFHMILQYGVPQDVAARQAQALRDLQAHPPRAVVFTPDYYQVQRTFSAQVRSELLPGYHRLAADPTLAEYETWLRNP